MNINQVIFGQQADERFRTKLRSTHCELLNKLIEQAQIFQTQAINTGITFPDFCQDNLVQQIQSGALQCLFTYEPIPDDGEPIFSFEVRDSNSEPAFTLIYFGSANEDEMVHLNNATQTLTPFTLPSPLGDQFKNLPSQTLDLADTEYFEFQHRDFCLKILEELIQGDIYPTPSLLNEFDLMEYVKDLALTHNKFNHLASDDMINCCCQYIAHDLSQRKANPESLIGGILGIVNTEDFNHARFARALLNNDLDLTELLSVAIEQAHDKPYFNRALKKADEIEASDLFQTITSIKICDVCEALEQSLNFESTELEQPIHESQMSL